MRVNTSIAGFNAWSECVPGIICHADVDFDGDVDEDDLVAVRDVHCSNPSSPLSC